MKSIVKYLYSGCKESLQNPAYRPIVLLFHNELGSPSANGDEIQPTRQPRHINLLNITVDVARHHRLSHHVEDPIFPVMSHGMRLHEQHPIGGIGINLKRIGR